MLAYFTQCIYFSLQWATSAGDTAAFVGHNAFLRWSALQEVSVWDEASGKTQWWSERHVSEDFEMSLKLQTKGKDILITSLVLLLIKQVMYLGTLRIRMKVSRKVSHSPAMTSSCVGRNMRMGVPS